MLLCVGLFSVFAAIFFLSVVLLSGALSVSQASPFPVKVFVGNDRSLNNGMASPSHLLVILDCFGLALCRAAQTSCTHVGTASWRIFLSEAAGWSVLCPS